MRTTLAATLLIALLAVPVRADDHGDSALTATPIDVNGGLLSACIDTAGDMDYFLFSAIAGRAYRVRATHQSAEMRSVLYLFASDGRTILYVSHQSPDGAGARIDWTCPANGTYFVMVRHAQASSGIGCYALSVAVEVLDDHGDDRLSATPLLVDAEPIPGFLEAAGDTDAFLVSVDAGYDYVATLTPASAEDALALAVSGDAVAAHTLEVTEEAHVDLAAQQAGSVFLFVSAPSAQPAAGYEIAVRRSGYGDDHGNEAAAATALDPQAPSMTAAIEVSGDADWFRFEAREGAEYSIVLSTEAGLGCRLTLRSPDGEVVLEDAAAAAGRAAELQWTAPADAVHYLEVAATAGTGAYTLDLTTVFQLEAAGRFNPSGYSLDVVARERLAYLIVGVKGLSIIDVDDPSTPREIGSHSTRGYAEAVALTNGFAVVANRGDGIAVIDISDPTRPMEVGALETPGWAQDVAMEGTLAAIADQRAGIHLVRIAANGGAELLSSYQTRGHAGAVTLLDGHAYIAIGDAGLEILDVSDPAAPLPLGRVAVSGDARDVIVRDGIAYVASGYRGVRIVDVTDPSSASEVGWFGTSDEAVALHLSGLHLYVAERTGISVYSLSDPRAPERVAGFDTPGEAIAVFALDDLVFVADRQEGLRIARWVP